MNGFVIRFSRDPTSQSVISPLIDPTIKVKSERKRKRKKNKKISYICDVTVKRLKIKGFISLRAKIQKIPIIPRSNVWLEG